MISVLAKNNTAINNSAYSLRAIKGMCTQIPSLARPILATVWVEKLDLYAAMENLLSLPIMARITKWCHVESFVKIGDIFQDIPSLVDGSFVSRFMRQSNELNNNLDTSCPVLRNLPMRSWGGGLIPSEASSPSQFYAGEKERQYLSPGLPVNGVEFPYCAACEHELIDHPPSNETAKGLNDEMQ
jgi:hypothetical protein